MDGVAVNWQFEPAWLALAVVTGLLSYFSSGLVMKLAKKAGMIVQPGKRQSHAVATPTGGGLGLMFSIVLMSLVLHLIHPLPGFWWWQMLPGIVLLVLIGWHDDKYPVSSLARLLVHLVASLWLLSFGLLQVSVYDAVLLAGAVLAMVWMMNLFNFMDGSNGMAGFQGVFAALAGAILFYLEGP